MPKLQTSLHTQKGSRPLSPLEILNLDRPQADITDGTEPKRQRKPDIASIVRQTDLSPDGANPPDLRHTQNSSKDTEAEGGDGGDAGREFGGLVVDLQVVAEVAALEEEVFAEGDAFVDGDPVSLPRDG